MKVFLTGGTGFIGQYLTKSLVARGLSITALVRKVGSTQARSLSKMGVQLVAGDITDRKSMLTAMERADIVVHNAGYYEYGVNKAGKKRMHAINVIGTDNVLGLAYEIGVPRSVYVSSTVAFGDSTGRERDETFKRQVKCNTTYEQSKADAHNIACKYQMRGLPLIIVCPNSVVGANDHSQWGYFLRLYINRALPPIAWSPNAIHGCLDVRDLAEGITLAAEKGLINETYFLSGEFKSLHEHLNYWSSKPGAFKPIFWLPPKIAALIFAPYEQLQRMLNLPAFISRETVKAASANWHYSSGKAKRELNWTHRTAEAMWSAAIDGELELLSRRKGQNLIQRLKPLDVVNL